jgi:hypothetical protein
MPGYREFSNLPGTLTPDQPGPWAVGYTELILEDPSRNNNDLDRNVTANEMPRKIFSSVWYPANASLPSAQPLATYTAITPLYNGQFTPVFAYLPPDVTFPSPLGARWLREPGGAAGAFPLILIIHSSNGYISAFRGLAEGLASHGFVVAGMHITGNDYAAIIPGSGPVVPALTVPASQRNAFHARVFDGRLLAAHLLALAANGSHPIYSRINATAGYGCYGHSLGGSTCLGLAGGTSVNGPSIATPKDPTLTAVFSGDFSPPVNFVPPHLYPPVAANITVPAMIYGPGLQGVGDLFLDAMVGANPRYYALAPGSAHFPVGGWSFCEDSLAMWQRTAEGREYVRASITAGPLFVLDHVHHLFQYCACPARVEAIRALPQSVWAERGASIPREWVARMLDAAPTTSIPEETYLNLARGYVTAFFQAHLAHQPAYQAYLTADYANATFGGTELLVFYENTTAGKQAANLLDVADNSAITFDPAGDVGYAVRYHPQWGNATTFQRDANGTFGTSYISGSQSYTVYPTRVPFTLQLQFGFRLPPPSNRSQGEVVREAFVHPAGKIHFGTLDYDVAGPHSFLQTADYATGFMRRYGAFAFFPLHGVWQTGGAGTGISVINEASRFVVTWDRVKAFQDNGTGINSFQFALFSNGSARFTYGVLGTRDTPLPLRRTAIAAIGVSDGLGYATEGGVHHAVKFTNLTEPRIFSVGSITEVFRGVYDAPGVFAASAGEAGNADFLANAGSGGDFANDY